MKHILIYIIIALGIFGMMSLYFSQNDQLTRAAVTSSEVNVAKQSIIQVGILFENIENQDKVEFRSSLKEQLGVSANVVSSDCGGDPSVQMSYFKMMLGKGCKYIFVDNFQSSNVDEMITLAAGQEATLILMNGAPTAAQLQSYEKLYSIGCNEENDMEALADMLSGYWVSNREEMDFKVDDTLAYAAVSNYGFVDSGKAEQLEELMSKKGCPIKLVSDTVTEYLNYDFEYELDQIYFANAEAILFADSADAEKAYAYYHDPSEYSKTPKIKLIVMSADETAYSLYETDRILCATGNGGPVLGRMAAQMVTTLEGGGTLSYSTIGTNPTNGGRTFLCNNSILRNIIISETEEEEE